MSGTRRRTRRPRRPAAPRSLAYEPVQSGGLVYLIHFDRPFSHARHYVGWSRSRAYALRRIAHHAAGSGSRYMRKVSEAGVPWQVVRIFWQADRAIERRLKDAKNTAEFCPSCRGRKVRLRDPRWRFGGRT